MQVAKSWPTSNRRGYKKRIGVVSGNCFSSGYFGSCDFSNEMARVWDQVDMLEEQFYQVEYTTR